VALGQLISGQSDIPTGINHYSAIDFAFGLPREASAVPTSGSAAYALSFRGTRSSVVVDAPLNLLGGGAALIDFGTWQFEISGTTASFTSFTSFGSGGSTAGFESEGAVRGSGALVSGENGFTATFTATADASGTCTGAFAGSFYGPGAEDIGGTLYGTCDPLFYSLAFAGYELPDTAPDDTLDNLTGSTRFQTVRTYIDLLAVESLRDPLGESIIYDADTQTYTVKADGSRVGFGFLFGPANRTASEDAGGFRAYAPRCRSPMGRCNTRSACSMAKPTVSI
jgi:hypothetical protein